MKSRLRRLGLACVLALAVPVAAAAEPNFRISAGASSGDFFGLTLGLDFRGGTLYAAWPDNSAALGGNPDIPALDVAFARASGSGAVSPGVNVTHKPLSQTGVSLAVSPIDPNVVVAATVDAVGTVPTSLRAFSRDGGATWTVVGGLPGNFGGFSPQVAFDEFGNCFLALVHDPNFGNPRLELFLSIDGGATFAQLPLPDLPGLETRAALDAGSGSVWLAFQGYDGTVKIQTWSAPVQGLGQVGPFSLQTLPGSAGGVTPDVAIGGDGRALVAYGQGQFTSTPAVVVHVDPDGTGGAGFGNAVRVSNVRGYPHDPRPRVDYGAPARAYVVFEDKPELAQSEDVLLSFSDDGAAWSATIRLNDDVPSAKRLLPSIAVDPLTGAIGVAWLDFRSGASELWADVRASVSVPAEPRAPLDLAAIGVSRSQIDLMWTDTSVNETGFQVQRHNGNPFEQPQIVATLGPNVTTWSDTGLPEDSSFSYRVRAINAAGASRWSNGASATTLDTPPSAPTNLVASAITFQRIDLRWSPSDDPDGYEIEESKAGGPFVSLGRSASTATEAMLFGRAPETTYCYRIRAFNSGGDSPYSNVSCATTLSTEQPSAPTNLTAVALPGSKIDLSWRDNSVNETRFEIERSTGSGPFQRVGTARADSQRFSDTGLKRGTTYTYRVRAVTAGAASPYSNTASATTFSR